MEDTATVIKSALDILTTIAALTIPVMVKGNCICWTTRPYLAKA